MYKLPERRGGGEGEVIWAMPERKHFFFHEVFPYVSELCVRVCGGVGGRGGGGISDGCSTLGWPMLSSPLGI